MINHLRWSVTELLLASFHKISVKIFLQKMTHLLWLQAPRQQAPRQQKRQEDKRIQYRHHEIIDCQNCGGQHKRRECPAFDQECRSCHRLNHWAKMCRSTPKVVNSIHNDDDPPLFIDAITNGVKHLDTAYAVITILPAQEKTSVLKLTLVHMSTSYPHLYMRK